MATKNKNNVLKYILAAVLGVAAFLVVFFLVKNPGQEQVVTYEYRDDNGTVISMTYYARGDRVYKQTTKNIVPFSALGVDSLDEAKELAESLIAEGQNIEGYSDKVEYEDDTIIETVEVNYDVVDMDILMGLQGAYFGDGDAKNGVSLKKSIEWLEESGFVEVEK